MKKTRLIALLLAIILTTGLFAANCSPADKIVSSIDLKSGTYKTVYEKDETIDYSKIKLILTYTDGTKSDDISHGDFTTNTIDTSVPGTYDLIATYIDKLNNNSEHTVKKKVTVSDGTPVETPKQIRLFDLPANILDYQANIKEQTADNKKNEFMVRNNDYTVGSDNPFVFFPQMQVRDNDGDPVLLDTYAPIINIYDISINDGFDNEAAEKTESAELTPLEDEQLSEMVEITADKGLYQFTEKAVGKSFRITLQLHEKDIHSTFVNQLKNKVLSFDFRVIEGYNAYNAADLSMFDNTEIRSDYDLYDLDKIRWKEFKAAAGLPLIGTDRVSNIKALILHNDIELVKNDFPSSFFHNDIDGSLKDNWNLFSRITPANEEFTFIGNYYTLDASKIPLITIDGAWDQQIPNSTEFVIQNTNLFTFGGPENGGWLGQQGINNITSVSFIGNTPRTENNASAGGMKLLQTLCKEVNVDNIIARSFFTMFISQSGENSLNPLNVSNSRCHDVFSQMFFLWDAMEVNIEKSEFRDSGGPIFVLTDYEKGPEGNYSNINMDTESVAESWLEGNEIWFTLGNAVSIAASVKAISQTLAVGGKSIVKKEGGKELVNMIAVIKPENFAAQAGHSMRGAVTVGNSKLIDMSDPVVSALKTATLGQAPIFQSSGGGYGAFIGPENTPGYSGLVGYTTALNPPFAPIEMLLANGPHALFDGNYVNIFYQDMGILLNYFPTPTTP